MSSGMRKNQANILKSNLLKATAEEPKKINEAKNGGFEVEIFGEPSARKAPMEQD